MKYEQSLVLRSAIFWSPKLRWCSITLLGRLKIFSRIVFLTIMLKTISTKPHRHGVTCLVLDAQSIGRYYHNDSLHGLWYENAQWYMSTDRRDWLYVMYVTYPMDISLTFRTKVSKIFSRFFFITEIGLLGEFQAETLYVCSKPR